MDRPFILGVVALVCLITGCKESPHDRKAEIVAETMRHIEQLGPKVARLSKLTDLTPASDVMRTLRLVTGDLTQWQREYRTLRAKMIGRNVSQAEHQEVNRHYKSAVEDLRLKVEQAERRVSRRSDTQVFYVDLHRMRQLVRDL